MKRKWAVGRRGQGAALLLIFMSLLALTQIGITTFQSVQNLKTLQSTGVRQNLQLVGRNIMALLDCDATAWTPSWNFLIYNSAFPPTVPDYTGTLPNNFINCQQWVNWLPNNPTGDPNFPQPGPYLTLYALNGTPTDTALTAVNDAVLYDQGLFVAQDRYTASQVQVYLRARCDVNYNIIVEAKFTGSTGEWVKEQQLLGVGNVAGRDGWLNIYANTDAQTNPFSNCALINYAAFFP
jgi:hypothetical protein